MTRLTDRAGRWRHRGRLGSATEVQIEIAELAVDGRGFDEPAFLESVAAELSALFTATKELVLDDRSQDRDHATATSPRNRSIDMGADVARAVYRDVAVTHPVGSSVYGVGIGGGVDAAVRRVDARDG
jgi:hypothetical protein